MTIETIVRLTFLGAVLAIPAGCASTTTTPEHERPAMLYEQPAILAEERVGLGFFSHAEAGATRDYIHCDNFTLPADAQVTGVRWWGYVNADTDADLSNVRGFHVEIHPDHEARRPDEPLLWRTVSLRATDPRPTGRRGSGRNDASAAREYRHEVHFDRPLRLRGGVTYHLSIAAVLLDPATRNWMWADGETVDGLSDSYSYARDEWGRIDDTDSAFALLGFRDGDAE